MNAQLLQTLEHRRKGHLLFLKIALLASMFFVVWVYYTLTWQIAVFAGVVCSFINTGLYLVLKKDFSRRGKALIMADLVRGFHLTYNPSRAFPVGDVYDHGIIPPYDISATEDGFTGNEGAYPIAFQEVILKQRHHDEVKKTTSEIMVFKGLMIRIDLKKRLEFHTVIIPNKFLKPSVDAGNVPWHRGFEEVKIVSPQFSKQYKIFSTHQVESRVIFDPLFIERFMELGAHLKSGWLEASFMGRELLITARYKQNFFEIGSMLRPVMEDNLINIEDEIRHILGITDILKHNTYFTRTPA